MSIVINRAPLVEITLLKSILATSISAVGVATSPGQFILSPPTVNLVPLGSAFLGWAVQNKLAVHDVFHSIFGFSMLMNELNGVGWIFNASSHSIG